MATLSVMLTEGPCTEPDFGAAWPSTCVINLSLSSALLLGRISLLCQPSCTEVTRLCSTALDVKLWLDELQSIDNVLRSPVYIAESQLASVMKWVLLITWCVKS